MHPARKLFLPLLPLLLLLACNPPRSYEEFIPAEHSGGLAFDDNVYRFDLDLSDSTAVYDVYFYTRVENTGLTQVRSDHGQLGLEINWLSPLTAVSDSSFTAGQSVLSETVYMPLGDDRGSKTLYRSGVSPGLYGLWTLEVKTLDAPKGLRGLGIICKKRNGTR